ncbi:inovirus-type Gp2 protein [Nitrosomonas supralitoralis]|nr:inovirus-type Gp2 protein [Nitrosomonas supralitoralis]
MNDRLDLSDLDIVKNGCIRLVAPIDETDTALMGNREFDFSARMRLVEKDLEKLPSMQGCLEIIKKNYSDNDKPGKFAKRNIPYYKMKSSWHRVFVKSLPNLVLHIFQLPRESNFSVQVEAVRALCRDRIYWFDDYEAFRSFCNDPNRFYITYGKEYCERSRAFINDFVKNLHLKLQEPATRKKIRCARKAAKKRTKEFRKYVLSLFAARTPINVIRIDLGYSEYTSIETIINDLKHFHRNMRHNPKLFKHRIGYIEKIEFGLSKGIHAHVILFYSSERQSSANVNLAQSIGEYWVNEITHGKGSYMNINALADHYRRLGRLGIGEIHAHDANGISWLCYDVEYFCKVEQFIKPAASPKTKLLRRGAMPKLSKHKPGRPRKLPNAKMTSGDAQSSYNPNKTPISTITPLPNKYPYPNQLPWPDSLKNIKYSI